MRIDEFNQMQQNLEKMRQTLNNQEHIENVERILENSPKTKKRQAARVKLNKSPNAMEMKLLKDERIIVITTIIIVIITFVFSSSIFAQTISENISENQVAANETETKASEQVKNEKESEEQEEFVAEKNENAIELEDVLMENVSVLKSKEFVEEERPVEFEITYNENPNLPEGEEVITQEGINGKQQVTAIKSYENDKFVSENILEAIKIEEAVPQVVDLGTSKFLAEKKVHLGDKMYATEEIVLRESADNSSNQIDTILQSLDVKIKELSGEEWCKVRYHGNYGYVETKYLTSAEVTPEIVEANRIQKIKMGVNENMDLNKSTKLTLEDYKRILSGNASDRNGIIEENAEVFYNMDQKYNMNGVFLASIAIHESGWGTSKIAQDKKNLFGYGAYDSSPYQSSFGFDSYADGIEVVAKALVKYYINEQGTPIYDDEVAKGSYYNGTTVADVNVRYASDTNWHNKVYKYMQYLYERL